MASNLRSSHAFVGNARLFLLSVALVCPSHVSRSYLGHVGIVKYSCANHEKDDWEGTEDLHRTVSRMLAQRSISEPHSRKLHLIPANGNISKFEN